MSDTYDPKKAGALCDLCPLGPNGMFPAMGGPVRPTCRGSAIVAVGQEPGEDEVLLDEPLVGPSGREYERGLEAVGWADRFIDKNNVLACRPPKRLKFLLAELAATNKRLAKAGKPTIPTPMQCCAPRLLTETRRFPHVIALGNAATALLVPQMRGSFDAARGKMIEVAFLPPGAEPPTANYVPGRKILPTYNPAMILREKGLRKVFVNDLGRARRFFENRLEWAEPWVFAIPSPEQIRQFLSKPMIWRGRPAFTIDTETSFDAGPWAEMHCMQIGTTEGAIVIPVRSRHDPERRFYSPAQWAEIEAILKAFLLDDGILKIGHNILLFDRGVLEQPRNLGAWPVGSTKSRALLDTILVKRCAQPDTDHNLGYCGSFYTDVHDWKCYDGQTEVLTGQGWVRLDEYSGGAVVQWEAGHLRFVGPTAHHAYEYTGPMHRFKSDAVDLLVTPNHKMLVQSERGVDQVFRADAMPRTGKMHHAGIFDGWADLFLEDDLLRLLVAFQADGTWVWRSKTAKASNETPTRLDFGFTKPRKIERLRQILDALEMPYEIKQTAGRTRIWCQPHLNIGRLWALLGPRKALGPWVLRLRAHSRRLIADEAPHWDGTAARRNYMSTLRANADWMQLCHVLDGRQARVRTEAARTERHQPQHRVNVVQSGRPLAGIADMAREVVPFSGTVYCLTVPSGFLLVRRDGKVTICGNSDHTATEAKSDEELWKYGGLDTVVNARITEPMFAEVVARDQVDILRIDHRIADICYDMSLTGMRIQQTPVPGRDDRGDKRKYIPNRQHFEEDWTKKSRIWAYRCRALLQDMGVDMQSVTGKLSKKAKAALEEEMKLGRGLSLDESHNEDWKLPGVEFLGEDFLLHNPASHLQLRALLFDEWGLEPPSDLKPEELLTSSGEISTSDSVMRALLQRSTLSPMQRRYIRAVRTLRKSLKVLGTFLLPMRPGGELLGRDGRIHPRWLNFIPITGRVASRGPNAQNWIKWVRAMVVPEEGNLFVAADKDQLELRLAACYWNLKLYLDAFRTIEDPHQVTMALVLGGGDFEKGVRVMTALPGAPSQFGRKDFAEDSEFDKTRKLDKNVQFCSQYGGREHVLHRLVTSIENDKGDFMFGDMLLDGAAALRQAWLNGVPEIEAGWKRTKQDAVRQGYLREPIGGRRRDFVDGGTNLSEIVNFPIQAGGASCVNLEMIELSERFPRGFGGVGTGLINQCHDQIVIECRAEHAEEVRQAMQQVMGEHWFPGFSLPMTAKAKIAHNWKAA